jgi:hypothetical protein
LVYGQEAVLPLEITAGSRHIEFHNDLTAKEYAALMNDNIEDLTELRLWSPEKIKENKAKVAHAYNKKVKLKEFQVRDLVWEVVLPLGTKDAAYGKWSPNWHRPYRIDQVLPGNAYMLEELDGVKFLVAVNGQHLKKYFPQHVGQWTVNSQWCTSGYTKKGADMWNQPEIYIYIITDEQPSTLEVPNFKQVLGYRSP